MPKINQANKKQTQQRHQTSRRHVDHTHKIDFESKQLLDNEKVGQVVDLHLFFHSVFCDCKRSGHDARVVHQNHSPLFPGPFGHFFGECGSRLKRRLEREWFGVRISEEEAFSLTRSSRRREQRQCGGSWASAASPFSADLLLSTTSHPRTHSAAAAAKPMPVLDPVITTRGNILPPHSPKKTGHNSTLWRIRFSQEILGCRRGSPRGLFLVLRRCCAVAAVFALLFSVRSAFRSFFAVGVVAPLLFLLASFLSFGLSPSLFVLSCFLLLRLCFG